MRWILVMVLACSGCRGSRAYQPKREELARVNEERIYRDELEKETRRAQDESAPTLEDRRRTLATMIDRKLLLQEAERQRVFVPLTQSDRMFTRLKDDYSNGDFGKTLEEQGLSPTELKESIHDRLVVSKLLKEQVYERIYIEDEEMLAYYQAHPELAAQPERVHCGQIVQKTEAEIQKVRAQIGDGMPFAEAATRFSLAPESQKGGDLGWFERGIMPTAIEDGCFARKVGELSAPVPSEFGFHLFKLLGRRPAETLSFERVRDKIEMILRKQRAEKDELAFVATLRKKADIVIDDALLAKMR